MSQRQIWVDLTLEESDDESNSHTTSRNVPHPDEPSDSQYFARPTVSTSTHRNGFATMPPRTDVHRSHAQWTGPSHSAAEVSSSNLIPQHRDHTTQCIENRDSAQSRSSLTTYQPSILGFSTHLKRQKECCTNCAEVGVTCDGEKPCSACVEPGLTCYYPGEKSDVHMLDPKSITLHKQNASFITQSRMFENQSATTRQSLLPRPNTLGSSPAPSHSSLIFNQSSRFEVSNLHWRTAATGTDATSFDTDASEDDDNDNASLGVSDLEEVKRLLKKHEARLREHQAYLLQPLLNQAKIDARKARVPGRKSTYSPFMKLVQETTRSHSRVLSKSLQLQIHAKTYKSSASKKWAQFSVPVKIINVDAVILPKYKSIGRLGPSVLAPNVRTLKYWPYFPDEENLDPSEAQKNEELEERYQHDDNHLLAQRKCSELANMWQSGVADFVSKLRIEFTDILYWFLHTTEGTTCDICERELLPEAFTGTSDLLTKPPEHALAKARLAAVALQEVTKISMLHFVLSAVSVQDLMKQLEPVKKSSVSLCSICFLYNCLTHGAYQEPEESEGAVIMGGNVEINDEEAEHNVRISVSVPNQKYDEVHQCGLYCVPPETRLKDILGRKKDGTVGGIHNRTTYVPRLSIANDVLCNDDCYWSIEKRTKFGTVVQIRDYQLNISEKWKAIFRRLVRVHSDNQRAPCMIASQLSKLSCVEVFYGILAESQRVSHYRHALADTQNQASRKNLKLASNLDTSLSADLDERPPFVPCSHTGSCLNNPDCTCFANKVHCEWFCGCDKSCERRFPGCKCASSHKICFNDKTCECWKHNRECDPWVCGTCGVVEVLDPRNKYKNEIRRGRCRNNRIQLELPARTVKAPSEIQGWGLYAGVDLEEQSFIGEYKGETIGNQESDRRGAVYANIGQEYLFVMNRDQQIDGSNFGNKTRFINNSQRDDCINVYAKKLLCNGVQRVMLYAKKSIKAGEEMLYNYNYPISVTKKFWERGEGPSSTPGAVVAKPSITWTQPRVNGRYAKVATSQEDEEEPSAGMNSSRNALDTDGTGSSKKKDAKRKRAEIHDSIVDRATMSQPLGSKSLLPTGALQFPEDTTDDSDFELVDPSESSESQDEVEADSDPVGNPISARKRRVVPLHDGRRGGAAQTKAWETRRKRTTKGK